MTDKEEIIKQIEELFKIELFDWQKNFIFENLPYGREIQFARRAGKILAHCLRLCLSEGKPIYVSKWMTPFDEEKLRLYAGEDESTPARLDFFIDNLQEIYEKLKETGKFELRKIYFLR